ncbi:MAG: hypothetical protein QN174_04755 [Armatimonadota bacterium]|nr:hypothetical protein [Armatimonadota bacterium]MDR7421369.1 hypothetical protein [Armatimonadota bacterium]MDR7453319.1 hypothetical protein [Armatimonadota bacterium]MDR7456481.1 hypothetical protein [Armatimonadota bacterium]MDR7496252.1 hypothetical protein [Armatimonadota bacterium]
MRVLVATPRGTRRGRFWRRLVLALVAAYAVGYVLEAATGNWDPGRVGWGYSFVPVAFEGGVFAFVLGGVWGVLLAPLPLLIAPETWVRVSRLLRTVGPMGLLILVSPLPVMWGAGAAGALVRLAMPWLAARRRR